MATLVFANGQLELRRSPEWLERYFAQSNLVIAADGGCLHLRALGRFPDIVVGDLDSLPAGLAEELRAVGTRLDVHPVDKDATDLELALQVAAAETPDSEAIIVLAALGGRLDQALANVLLLAQPALAGRPVKIAEPGQEAWLVIDQTVVEGDVGDLVSLVPLDHNVLVAETSGLAWPLRDEPLAFGRARGVSNRLTQPLARIRLSRGVLLCIHIRADAVDALAS